MWGWDKGNGKKRNRRTAKVHISFASREHFRVPHISEYVKLLWVFPSLVKLKMAWKLHK